MAMAPRIAVGGVIVWLASVASCAGDDVPFDPLVNRDTRLAELELRSVSVSALYVDAGETPKVQLSLSLWHSVGDAGTAEGELRVCPRLGALTVALESGAAPVPFSDPGGWRPRSQEGSFRCAAPSTTLELAPVDREDSVLIVEDGSARFRIDLGAALRPRHFEPTQGRGWDFAVGERTVLRWSSAEATTEIAATLEFVSLDGDRGSDRAALTPMDPELLELTMPSSRLYGAGLYHLLVTRRGPVPCGEGCMLESRTVFQRPGILREVRVAPAGPVTHGPACGRSTPPGRCAASR